MFFRSSVRAIVPILTVCLLASCLFALTFYYDNKYISPPPYGTEGVLSFDDENLGRPLSLVDGWELSVDGSSPVETFIGQYSNLSFVPGATSPVNNATYALELHYSGEDAQRAVVLLLPEVFGNYTLYVDGEVAAVRGDGSEVGLVVDERTVLELEIENQPFYYSGLTYPPVLGAAQAVAGVQVLNVIATCILVLVPLVVATLTLAVRRKRRKDNLLRDFGVLCVSLAVSGAHGIAWRLGVAGVWWYALEDAAWMCVLAAAVSVAARAVGVETLLPRKVARRWFCLLWLVPVACFVWVALVIPFSPDSAAWYGLFQTAMRVLYWVLFAACAVVGVRRHSAEARFVLCGCAVLGASLLANMFDNNAFEPLRGLWQHEYAGLFLVGVFGWLLVARIRRLRSVQEQVHDLEVQVRAAGESLMHMRRGEQELRIARHDLRHHVGVLKQLADDRQWDRCGAYLQELSQQQDAQAPLRYSENLVVNAVMAAYLSPAQASGVQIECDVKVPEVIALRSTELVVLLSNLLANAAEACARVQKLGATQTFIALSIRMQGQQLIIRCKNTAEPGATFSRTTKSDTLNHGLGLSAMRNLVENRGGVLIAEIDGDVACVRLVVPLDKDEGEMQSTYSNLL